MLEAVRQVPRDRFVPEDLLGDAWDNIPLPIGCGQTISQPLVVARMCELLELRGGETVLDVGTGSGYHAALLAQLVAHVWSVELHEELSERAALALARGGRPQRHAASSATAPSACPSTPPTTRSTSPPPPAACREPLIDQLADGGRLVAPVEDGDQRLVLLRRRGGRFSSTELERVRFVPLVG